MNLEAWFDEQQPWKAGFLSLMRCVAARDQSAPLPSLARLPQQESFRLGQQPSMAFAPREIESLARRNDKLHIRLFGLGVWGVQGPLPLHMTELAYWRAETIKDTTLVRFADLFHHRALSLFYRAWAVSQPTASLDRPKAEAFSLYIGALAGTDPTAATASCLPVHARLAASSHLVREARNPDGLTAALAHYFGIPVQLHEYVLHWISLGPSTLVQPVHTAAVMAESATLGTHIPDRQHKFRLILGPLDLGQYLRFTPGGSDLPALKEWVRAFTGFEYSWDITLLLHPAAPPSARLGGPEKLGHATWLGQPQPHAHSVEGLTFEPEQYGRHTLQESS